MKSAAKGSDIWPVTWAANQKLYSAWGDGNGFSGKQKASWGVSELKGNTEHWQGMDIFYGPNGSGNGKISGLLAIGNIIYGWENTQDSIFPFCNFKLIKSTDLGKSWKALPVKYGKRGFRPVSFVNFGAGYQQAKDDYVYILGFKSSASAHRVYMARVKKSQIENASAYEYVTALKKGKPIWGRDTASLFPIFKGEGDGNPFPVMIYNKGLQRYILTDCHGHAGQIGVFESPTPWGPWKTIYYTDHWGGLTTGEYLGFEFPNKWTSKDGRQLGMVFSVYNSSNNQWNDACNIMPVTLTISQP